jgi:phage terminase small subunit
METMTRDEVVRVLVECGTRKDEAVQYADAFLEYQAATANIEAHGLIVGHPRTGNPIENPYLAVRDRALKKLQGMRTVKAYRLWDRGA